VPFKLKGPNGLVSYLTALLDKKGHAVVCVAEGAGQHLLYEGEGERGRG
jgi:6-phosphofructokinase 1